MTRPPNIHEELVRDETAGPGSPRTFGLVMAAAVALLALSSWHRGGHAWTWEICMAGGFAAAALLFPAALQPLNRLWFRLGLLLHAVVNPLIMAVIFFGVIWPTGLVMRWRGRRLLDLGREPGRDSYWIVRQPPGPAPQTMKDQF